MLVSGRLPGPIEFGWPGRGSNHITPLFIRMQVVGSTTRLPIEESKVVVSATIVPPASHVVMCVVITATGDVSKRAFTFDGPVDPGLVDWAAQYLNEQLAGLQLGTAGLRRRFEDSSLGTVERSFLEALKPTFTDLLGSDGQRVFVGGAANLLADARREEREAAQQLLEALERRAALLAIIGEALDPQRTFVRVGDELEPALHDAALVGASYGLATRRLGSVSLLGPVRMDYEKAIRTVRAAARELSRFVEDVYEAN